MTEDEIIEFIKRNLPIRQNSVVVGPGDDAAVLSYNSKEYLLLTTDCIVEDVHFNRKKTPLSLIARKAIAVNLSDIAAMGGVPLYGLVSIGLDKEPTRRDISQIVKGLYYMTERFRFDIVGGNITRSDKLFIDVSLAGKVEKKYLKMRSGAGPGDLIYVTGRLGGSRIKKHLTFIPRIKESREIIKRVSVSSMMDISDGLSTDLIRLAKTGGVGFKIYLDKIPVSTDAIKISKTREEATSHALNDGEDYELLFTVPKSYRDTVPESINSLPLTCIGEITKEKRYRGISFEGKEVLIQPLGYFHF
ncbi:MAG: thiamine-phosphate kinase [Candidatus Omnitrophica bacterium]|nr:thiamine-phosphate kinase [Candidatus Omnitrophota bacterium]